jgi:hypothetical protein
MLFFAVKISISDCSILLPVLLNDLSILTRQKSGNSKEIKMKQIKKKG